MASFDSDFVPEVNNLSEEDKIKLQEMFNGLLEDQDDLGSIMLECDKDALSDKLNDFDVDMKKTFVAKLREENMAWM